MRGSSVPTKSAYRSGTSTGLGRRPGARDLTRPVMDRGHRRCLCQSGRHQLLAHRARRRDHRRGPRQTRFEAVLERLARAIVETPRHVPDAEVVHHHDQGAARSPQLHRAPGSSARTRRRAAGGRSAGARSAAAPVPARSGRGRRAAPRSPPFAATAPPEARPPAADLRSRGTRSGRRGRGGPSPRRRGGSAVDADTSPRR